MEKKNLTKKTKKLDIRLTEDEYAMLQILANYYNAPKSRVIVKLIDKDYHSFFENNLE